MLTFGRKFGQKLFFVVGESESSALKRCCRIVNGLYARLEFSSHRLGSKSYLLN